jgi:transcriptional regulator with XRE-family HTH domain
MESLGNKIKKIRLEKDLKQSALHTNQSAIAQIEGGKNKKPSPTTIQTIAQNLGITMEELVKDTDWKAPESMVEEGKYGYSELDFDVVISEDGQIDIQFRQYPRYDMNGLENKYCPSTSSRLLFECKECKKPIISDKQIFCMGCGEKVFQSANCKTMDEFFKNNDWNDYGLEVRMTELYGDRAEYFQESIEETRRDQFRNYDDRKARPWYFSEILNNRKNLEKLIRFLQYDSSNVYGKGIQLQTRNFHPDELVSYISYIEDITDEQYWELEKNTIGWLNRTNQWSREVNDKKGKFFHDYLRNLKAKDEKIYNFHIDMQFRQNLYQKMADELKKYLNKNDISSLSNDEKE